MDLVKEMPLSNHLVVEVWDYSRPIATDTTKVELAIKIKVDVKRTSQKTTPPLKIPLLNFPNIIDVSFTIIQTSHLFVFRYWLKTR